MKILAIDDNRDNLTTLAALLKYALPGCTVATAANGAEGLALAGSEDPDVILLDIIMPGMDGFEVCSA
jgi:CheY-like chemotaxis protein